MKTISKILIFSLIIFIAQFQAQTDDVNNTAIIFSFVKEEAVSANFNFSELRDEVFYEIMESSIFGKNIDKYSSESLDDSVTIATPELIISSNDFRNRLSNKLRTYLIVSVLDERNQLIKLKTKVYHIYNSEPVKYIELFSSSSKYYYPFTDIESSEANKMVGEFIDQLKAGFDNKINVVFKKMKIDTYKEEHNFLKNAVPEYIKSRLVISEKIKVHRDSIITPVPGVTKKPHYTIDAYAFDDRDRVHIIVNCNDIEDDRVIITKQISFSNENPEFLDVKLHEIGDEFRNAILRLYDSKIHKRLTRVAIAARPAFFLDPGNADVIGMKELTRKIIYSLISSFNTDTHLKKKFELVEDPAYYDKIEMYLNNITEPSVITNDLNADILISLQTIGDPNNFDLKIDLFNPKALREQKRIKYHTNIRLNSLERYIDEIYVTIRGTLLGDKTKGSDQYKKASDFFRLIPRKVGVKFNALHSLLFPEYGDMFYGNHLRPAVELSVYYASALLGLPVSAEVGFLYDFGDSRDYGKYGDPNGHTGTVYARNLNLILKAYLPFYGRVKKRFRYYVGIGGTLIDIHRVSTSVSAGSFEPGWILQTGLEYSFSYNIFLDINARFMASDKEFKTLDKLMDKTVKELYRVFYIGAGIGYEF